jgi:hypothetical protein
MSYHAELCMIPATIPGQQEQKIEAGLSSEEAIDIA